MLAKDDTSRQLSRKATRLLKSQERRESLTLGLGTELHNFNKLYNTVQARIDTGMDLQHFGKALVAMREVVCVLSSLPPDNLRLGVPCSNTDAALITVSHKSLSMNSFMCA